MVGQNLGLDLDDLDPGGDLQAGGDDDQLDLEDDRNLGPDDDDSDDIGGGDDDDDPIARTLDALDQDDRQQDRRQRQPDQRRQLDDLRPQRRRQPEKTTKDAQGNIRNAEGNIIARAGREARYYSERNKFRGQAETHKTRVTDLEGKLRNAVQIGTRLNTELKALQGAQSQIKEMGIDPKLIPQALTLFKRLQDNPGQELQRLLTRAAANGIQVGGTTPNGQNGGLFGTDGRGLADVIGERIAEALKPFKEQTDRQTERDRAQEQQRQQIDEANREVAEFFRANPEAVPYSQVFENALRNPQYAGKSLNEIWLAIQLNLRDRPRRQQRRPNSRWGRNVPSGRRAPISEPSDMAPPTSSYDSIVNDVLDQFPEFRRGM